MRLIRPAAAIALLALSAAACSDYTAPTATPLRSAGGPSRIVNGEPTGSAFGNVGAVMFDFNNDGLDGDDWFCTGSLISPTVFLTAAHCLQFLPANAKLFVSFSPNVGGGSFKALAAKEFHYDAQYTWKQDDPHDIGVVILAKASSITPMQLPPAGYLDKLAAQNGLKGVEFLNVGYGGDVNRTGTPTIEYRGVREVSTSTFMALESAWLWLSMQSSTGDGGDCYGDSGGPKMLKSNPNMVVATVVTGDMNCRATTKDYRVDTPAARAFLSGFVALP